MTDWAGGIETRNYGIRCCIDRYTICDFMLTVFSLALVAGALIFHSWVRNQIVAMGYESQKLSAEEESLLRIRERLILEEETLRNPERVEAMARNELDMVPLRPDQLLAPQHQDMDRSLPGVLAMIHPEPPPVKKQGSGKRSVSYSD